MLNIICLPHDNRVKLLIFLTTVTDHWICSLADFDEIIQNRVQIIFFPLACVTPLALCFFFHLLFVLDVFSLGTKRA